LKLSKLTTLKGLKLSKMSKLLQVVLLAHICVKVAGDSSQTCFVNAPEERNLAFFHRLQKYLFPSAVTTVARQGWVPEKVYDPQCQEPRSGVPTFFTANSSANRI
jgi:hypothetical protein